MPAPTPHVFSGWRTVSFPHPPEILPYGALFKSGGNILEVSARSSDVIRVRFSPTPSFKRDHSYVVEKTFNPEGISVTPATSGHETTLITASLRITIHHAPFGITFAGLNGRVLDEDDTSLGTSFAGTRVQIAKRLDDSTAIYGPGEKNGRLNKRGWCLGGYSYAMWATDAFAYDLSTDPLYVSVPFYLGIRDGRAFGIFLDNAYRTFFDIGRQQHRVLSFGAECGELDYYFINGPHPRDVVARYAQLTAAHRSLRAGRWATIKAAGATIRKRACENSPPISVPKKSPVKYSGSMSTTSTATRRSPGTRSASPIPKS